ncbi:MAG: 4-hydroxy-tetrahydrodipicolinate synthase [Cytophagaceae bacterium]|nr:4-hydroxy-tetrahydrodipicolinate synthase [Cytophagaceae bacterium]MDW8455762.1 4-hydroxy-tetrahydrodipicolinate synthase [Cytophagaceae bacterium]
MKSFLKGTGVALVTPFTSDGAVDYDSFEKLLEYVIKGGVEYVLVNGTTSESPTTTFEEKQNLLSLAKKVTQKRIPIVFGLGGNNTAEIIKTMSRIDFEGISALLSVSPYYNKPTQEGIYKHYVAIADASPVPVVLYNVPGRTSSNISAQTTIRLSAHPNIAGIKEASGNFEQALEILKHAGKDFVFISGDDLITVPMIAVGAQGVMSVLANAFPSEFSTMVRDALKGNFSKATEQLKKFVELNTFLYEEGNPVGIKQVLACMGLCKPYVRLPLEAASDGLRHKIESALKQLNIMLK